MKELSLLMFVFACGYVVSEVANHFLPSQKRLLFFFIPSQSRYNILWGFIFYLIFTALMIPQEYKIWTVPAILVLLGFNLYYRGLSRNLQNPRFSFFKKDLCRRLKKQENNDSLLKCPYTRKEALRVLGLAAGIENDNPLIIERLTLLEQAAVINPDFPYLKSLTKELRSALKNG